MENGARARLWMGRTRDVRGLLDTALRAENMLEGGIVVMLLFWNKFLLCLRAFLMSLTGYLVGVGVSLLNSGGDHVSCLLHGVLSPHLRNYLA